MLLLNFAHPLSRDQLAQAATLLGTEPEVRDIAVNINRAEPLSKMAQSLADAALLDPVAWQSMPLVVNPPGLAPLAVALAAEIHGRRGDFVPMLNIRPVEGSLPTRYEIAEIVDMQRLRQAARGRRITADQ